MNLQLRNTKTLRYLLVLFIILQSNRSIAQDINIYIPDTAFENYLLNNPDINTDGNNAITASEAAAVDGLLNISSLGIEDLTGLEYFYNITRLHMQNNPVKNVQLYNMGMLRELQASRCQITEIQTPPSIYGNFGVSHNRLLRVNLSGGDIHSGTMISLNSNKLKQIDLSDCHSVTLLDCKDNDLVYLDAKGVSGAALQSLIAYDNENLTCIQTFYATGASQNNLVDPNAYFSTEACEEKFFVMFYVNAPATIEIDGESYTTIEGAYYHMAYIQVEKQQEYNYNITADGYENYCGSVSITGLDQSESVIMTSKDIVNIPDAKFKAALTANSQIDLNGDGEIQVSEASNYNRFIDVSELDINDMTGIEAFTNIYSLTCSRNAINELNISTCINLLTLDCSQNNITLLDVSKNRALTQINCNNNPIQKLDLSKNKVLGTLDCSACQLDTLDLANNTGLGLLDCSNNTLTSLKLKNGKYNKPNTINALDNNLSCVQVDSVAYANTHWTAGFDEGVSFDLNCGGADILSGNVTIDGNTVYNETLSARVTNSNNSGSLSYQWKRDAVNISGATGQTYSLVEEDIATAISVEISSSVETGSITSTATSAITKAEQEAPATPTLQSRTPNSITLTEANAYEYAINGGTWQASPCFTNLSENTQYSLTMRYTEDHTHRASEASDALLASTDLTTALTEHATTRSFYIYPNPAQEELTVYLMEPGDDIILFNLVGEKVLQQGSTKSKTILNLSHLKPGIYFIQVNTSIKQLIKQ